MDAQELNTKLNESIEKIEHIMRTQSQNSRSYMFAKRYEEVITEAYGAKFDESWKRTGEWEARIGKDTSKVEMLLEMGFTEAVYGRGRNLLHTN